MKQSEKTTDTTIRTELREDNGIEYKYKLLMKESSHVASYGIPLYSISVEMIQRDGNITNAKTGEVFANIEKAINFFEKLVNNRATPSDLPYVTEDELSR